MCFVLVVNSLLNMLGNGYPGFNMTHETDVTQTRIAYVNKIQVVGAIVRKLAPILSCSHSLGNVG